MTPLAPPGPPSPEPTREEPEPEVPRIAPGPEVLQHLLSLPPEEALRPVLEPLLLAGGHAWHSVEAAVELVGSEEELRVALEDPQAFLKLALRYSKARRLMRLKAATKVGLAASTANVNAGSSPEKMGGP